MKKVYFCNAFSLNMLPRTWDDNRRGPIMLDCAKMTPEDVKTWLGAGDGGVHVIHAVGHPDTARVLSGVLGLDIPCRRENVLLAPGDRVIVAQYHGPRLPEGATQLPAGAEIDFWMIEVD